MSSNLLTIEQACERLNISRATLYRLIERGHIRRIYILGCPRFDPLDLQAYIDRHTVQRAPRRRRQAA